MIRRPPRSTRTDTLFPTRRSSDLNGLLEPVGQRLRRILVERLIAIDDDLVGARLARNLGLGFARYAGNDARAERLAQFDRGDPDAARGAEDKQRKIGRAHV